MGSTKKRHGGILPITDEEYERLEKTFDRINPILPDLFADPDIAVFDGKYYIYPTSDGYDNWSGNRFYVFSSEDGIHFKKGPLLLDVATEQVSWATGYAWAPCIARKGDTWYFYFCAKDQNGESCIGMAWAKHPEGPFTACEKPFITMPLAREWGLKMGYGGQTIDPSIYQEGEEFYLLFGNGHPAIGKLNEKMDGLVPGTIQNLEGLFDFREAVSVKKKEVIFIILPGLAMIPEVKTIISIMELQRHFTVLSFIIIRFLKRIHQEIFTGRDIIQSYNCREVIAGRSPTTVSERRQSAIPRERAFTGRPVLRILPLMKTV